MDLPRSIRTFNPGAMNYGPFAKKHGAIGTDGRLAIFPDEDTGYKAMSSLLDIYGRRGQNTVSSIIGGLPSNPNLAWAPRGVDNNSTDTYIKKVASKLGIAPDTPISPELRPVLMRAMAEYEAGVPLGSVPRPSAPAQPVQGAAAQAAPQTGAAPMQPYTGASPDDVSRQRKMAEALMMQGMSTEPVGHWTQALARVLQGGVGGMHQAQARQGEQQGNQALAQALSGGTPTAASLVSNPWTRDLGMSVAKAQLTAKPDLTNDQQNFAAAAKNPEFRQFLLDNKRAGATAITTEIKGEQAEAKAIGEGAGNRVNATMNRAAAGAGKLQQLGQLEARMKDIETGKLAPAKMTVGAWAKGLGVSDDTLAGIGIDPKMPGNAQAFTAITNKMMVDMIGAGGFPANNFSDADREFLLSTVPRLATEPGGNKLIIEAARRSAQLDIEKARALQDWRKANKNKSADDFEIEWAANVAKRDVFGDLKKMVAGMGGGAAQPPPQAVQMLQQDPSPQTKAQFDEVFGPGAADRVLGGR